MLEKKFVCLCVGKDTCHVCAPESVPLVSEVFDMDHNRIQRDLHDHLFVTRARGTRKTDKEITVWYWHRIGVRSHAS